MKKFIILILVVISSSCSYKFNGASIPGDMKTVTVQIFENNAALVVPYVSSDFTESLKTRIRNQTRLSLVQSDAHGIFEGRITNYTIVPVAIQDNAKPIAGANRLSISVNVKYTNTLDPTKSFEQTFERFKNFSLAGQSLQTVEPQLVKDVNAMLTEDIFNRAFSQW